MYNYELGNAKTAYMTSVSLIPVLVLIYIQHDTVAPSLHTFLVIHDRTQAVVPTDLVISLDPGLRRVELSREGNIAVNPFLFTQSWRLGRTAMLQLLWNASLTASVAAEAIYSPWTWHVLAEASTEARG